MAEQYTLNEKFNLAEEFPVEMDYFRSHEEELLREYPKQHVVIRGVEVVASYGTVEELFQAVEHEGLLDEPALVCSMDIAPAINPYVQVVQSA